MKNTDLILGYKKIKGLGVYTREIAVSDWTLETTGDYQGRYKVRVNHNLKSTNLNITYFEDGVTANEICKIVDENNIDVYSDVNVVSKIIIQCVGENIEAPKNATVIDSLVSDSATDVVSARQTKSIKTTVDGHSVKLNEVTEQLENLTNHCTGGNGMQEHSHVNKTVLDKFTENEEGNVLYGGKEISGGGGSTSIDDTTMTRDKTWSSEKINSNILNNTNTIWQDVNGTGLTTVNFTKESKLEEVEIWGNTWQDETDLTNIQHLGKLLVDSEGNPILDAQGREQYEVEIENFNNGNMFNKDTVTKSFGISNNGSERESQDYDTSDFIPVKYNATYWKGVNDTLKHGYSCIMYDENKIYIGNIINSNFDNTQITVSNNRCRYIRISVGKTAINDFYFSKDKDGIGIFQSSKQTILLPCQLMKVGNVADRLYWDSVKGKYIVEKKVLKSGFNNLGNFNYYVQDRTTHYSLNSKINKEIANMYCPYNSAIIISNLKPKNTNIIDIQSIQYSTGTTTGEYVLCSVKKELFDSLPSGQEVEKWFNDNNEVIYYKASAPQLIETNITKPLIIPTYKDKTHILVTSTNIDGTIKAKAPIDGGQAIQTLSSENTRLSSENEELKTRTSEMETSQEFQDIDISATQEAVDFLMFQNAPMSRTINNNEREVNKMAQYFAIRIMKKEAEGVQVAQAYYRMAMTQYPQYKAEVDLILTSEDKAYLIVEL